MDFLPQPLRNLCQEFRFQNRISHFSKGNLPEMDRSPRQLRFQGKFDRESRLQSRRQSRTPEIITNVWSHSGLGFSILVNLWWIFWDEL